MTKIVDFFSDALRKGHLSHSYLISGTENLELAKTIAKNILCRQEHTGCGSCSSCLKLASDNHPDLMVVVPDGAFTSHLQHLKVDDEIYLEKIPYGFLTLARYQKPLPKDLWLLATGTGLAPFLSMLQDFETWQNYQSILLVYSVRSAAELAYVDQIQQIVDNFAEGHSGFQFVPIITRDPQADLHERLPILIENGQLEQKVGLQFNPESTHIMLCGNPQMVEDTKEALKARGLSMNRRGEGNIAVENYW